MSSTVLAENNFLIPNATIIVEIVIFFILLGVLAKWVLPPVTDAVRERQEVIRKRLVEAEEAAARLASAEADYQQALADARHEASRIREEARQQGAATIAEAHERAQEEARGILDEARRQIETDRRQAFEQLRAEIGTLAAELAGRVVGEPLTGETGRDLVERYLEDVESRVGADGRGAAAGDKDTVRAD